MRDEKANDNVSDFMIAAAVWYGSARAMYLDGGEEHMAISCILYPEKHMLNIQEFTWSSNATTSFFACSIMSIDCPSRLSLVSEPASLVFGPRSV